MAKAAEKSAAQYDKTIQFHCVSSIAALCYEKDRVEISPGVANYDYAQQKAEIVKYFKENAYPHLDVSVTYPLFLIDEKPSKTLAGLLLKRSFER